MSASPATISTVHQAFAQRCAELNLPAWLCDSAGAIVMSPPAIPNDIDLDHLTHRITECAGDSSPLTAEPIPLGQGKHLLLLEEKNGSRRLSISAVVIPATEPVDTLAPLLGWCYRDLLRADRDRQTAGQFGEQLAQAYEQNTLLLNLSRALNSGKDPQTLAMWICQQLLEILPFAWIGIRFQQINDEVRELAGKFVLAGEAPCALDSFSRECLALLRRADSPQFVKLQQPGLSALATLVGSEVIAEPIRHDDRAIAILFAGNKAGPDPAVKSFELQLLECASGFLGIFHENIARFVEQESQFVGTVRALTASIDAKDHYTKGHSERVSHLAVLMAKEMNLDHEMVETFRIAGLVHDVGKLGVPEATLCKPGRPTDEEFAQIRKHPQIGYDILRDIPKFARTLPAVLHHHERWDGNGYPHRLSGENIPLLARVMALSDAFDAMSSDRSYRSALTRFQVLTEILHCAGGQFDPTLAEIFVRLDFKGYDSLTQKHSETERTAA